MSLTHTLKDTASTLGFDAVGIARVPADPPPGAMASTDVLVQLRSRLTAWLAGGYHATMTWMGRTPERRADPRLVLPGCRSVIVVGMNYDPGERPEEGPAMGRIARYAWGRDYHDTLGERLTALTEHLRSLAPDDRHRWYVDTGPVMEKAWAQQAGLGWIGKHTNLVSAEHGSWLVLGVILTTLALDPDAPGSDLCGTCTLCIKTCPTDAIVDAYTLDARRCLSYLTIEHRADDLSQEIAQQLGNHIFGCDDCLDVCPYNLQARTTRQAEFQPRPWTLHPSLSDLLTWTESDFRTRTQHSPIRRATYEGFRRNLRLAVENAGRRPPAERRATVHPVDPAARSGV